MGNEAGDRVRAQKDTIKFIACRSRSQENLRFDHLHRSCAYAVKKLTESAMHSLSHREKNRRQRSTQRLFQILQTQTLKVFLRVLALDHILVLQQHHLKKVKRII